MLCDTPEECGGRLVAVRDDDGRKNASGAFRAQLAHSLPLSDYPSPTEGRCTCRLETHPVAVLVPMRLTMLNVWHFSGNPPLARCCSQSSLVFVGPFACNNVSGLRWRVILMLTVCFVSNSHAQRVLDFPTRSRPRRRRSWLFDPSFWSLGS